MLPPKCRSVRFLVKTTRKIARRELESQTGNARTCRSDVLEAVYYTTCAKGSSKGLPAIGRMVAIVDGRSEAEARSSFMHVPESFEDRPEQSSRNGRTYASPIRWRFISHLRPKWNSSESGGE